jgi:hypothetical protein
MIRIILYGILFYIIYKFLRRLFEPSSQQRTSVRGDPKPEKQQPYDKSKAEDIDYEDV